jgi:acetyl-CoA carboxylase carboxyl transferase subunit alpha
MANSLKSYLLRYLRELRPLSADALVEARYQKFRKMGFYLAGPEMNAAVGGVS